MRIKELLQNNNNNNNNNNGERIMTKEIMAKE
jgi:hypothetical protein